MAGLGFKDFQVGEVLTSSDVDGYLMQQSVMRFADSGARGSALGTAPGTAVALAEGMVTYLDDVNRLEMYTGSTWITPGGFSASTAITATDASWTVPTLADPVVRVTVIGGGGGGGGGNTTPSTRGVAGSNSVFASTAGTATAVGGWGGLSGSQTAQGNSATDNYWYANNGGEAGANSTVGANGQGGQVVVAYYDLNGITTASVTVGGGGAGSGTGTGDGGGDGGDGVVIVEYRAR